jgi:nitric oxide reductase NorQ protein
MSVIDQYKVEKEPYYRTVSDEVELYESAYSVRMPMMLKGPTGCGKTRFVEYMAWKLNKPLITVACNEDMTASDLVGRFLLVLWPSLRVTVQSVIWMKWLRRGRIRPS